MTGSCRILKDPLLLFSFFFKQSTLLTLNPFGEYVPQGAKTRYDEGQERALNGTLVKADGKLVVGACERRD